MMTRIRSRAKAIPRRNTIVRELALPDSLQDAQTRVASAVKLRLGTCLVATRDCECSTRQHFQPHVSQRLVNLALE